MSQAQVTIVIPAYNAGTYLRETVASVQAQDGVHWQAVIVDDASSDDTLAITQSLAAEDERITAIAMDHGGVSVARNRGLEEANTPCTLFLDADDVLLPGALQRMVNGLDDQCVAVYGEAVVAQSSGEVTGATGAPVFGARPVGHVLESIIQHNFICTPGVLLARTDSVKKVGGFQPGLRLSEDWVLWCALAAEGPFTYLGPDPLLAYRQVEGGVSATIGQDWSIVEECINAVYALPAVQALDPATRARYRKTRTASAYAFMGTQAIKQRDFSSARTALIQSLQRNPGALRQWILLGCAMVRYLPASVERRLK